MITTFVPATPAQINFLKTLVTDRDTSQFGQHNPEALELIELGDPIDKRLASKLIDQLKELPRKQAAAQLVPGVYKAPNGDIVQLVQAKQSKNLYAKVLVEKGTIRRLTLDGDVVAFEYVYAPGLAAHLTPWMKLGAGEATQFGLRFGRCLRCGRKLKDASSVIQALGPTCAKYFL